MEFSELIEGFAASLVILNAFQIAEREKGSSAAEEVLIDAIHGGGGSFLQV